MRRVKLFIVICFVTGIAIVLCSALSAKLIKPNGIFIGAIIGGILGVIIAARIAIRLSLTSKQGFIKLVLSNLVGFIIAVFISVHNLDNSVVIVLSTAFIGGGAVLRDYLQHRNNPIS